MYRVVTDAVSPFRLENPAANKKLVLLPAAPLLAETIRRLHEEHSLTDLLVF
jgi:ribose-phosphate pyrophosphokinase